MGLSREEAREKLCLALDVATQSHAENVVAQLKDAVGVFKVGMQLFTSEGPGIVRAILGSGGKVFLDLKYHDIPNTVAEAGKVATRLGVTIFDIHASGGRRMMETTVESVRKEAEKLSIARPKILAITILTSLSAEILREELGIAKDLREQVVDLALLAKKSGVDGVVASPLEIELIRKACGEEFIILAPGIRPQGTGKQDQERVMTPREAIQAGASYIVVGRPILQADNPVTACESILADMVG